jgi:hypothetical protein
VHPPVRGMLIVNNWFGYGYLLTNKKLFLLFIGKNKNMANTNFEFDITLSFAGEDRQFVSCVAVKLKAAGYKVFYDEFEQINLWGKDLYTHLDQIYRNN